MGYISAGATIQAEEGSRAADDEGVTLACPARGAGAPVICTGVGACAASGGFEAASGAWRLAANANKSEARLVSSADRPSRVLAMP